MGNDRGLAARAGVEGLRSGGRAAVTAWRSLS
jgi:hypothetical protein